jgi:hypothetical protein
MMNRKPNSTLSVLFLFCVALVIAGILRAEDGPPAPPPEPPAPPVAPQPPAPAPSEEPKVDAEIYYSAKNPQWEQVKKLADELEKKHSEVRLGRIDIDTEDGRKKLAEAEKDHAIKESGEFTFIFGPYALVSKGDKRDVELYMEPLVGRIINPDPVKGRLSPNLGDYAKEIFGKEASVEAIATPQKDQLVLIDRVTSGGKFVGWAIDAFHPIICPICSDTQFLLALDPNLKTLDIRPLRQLERRALKLDDTETSKFLNQFKRVLPTTEDLKVNGISGATRTSLAYEQAMNEIIKELKKQEKK